MSLHLTAATVSDIKLILGTDYMRCFIFCSVLIVHWKDGKLKHKYFVNQTRRRGRALH